MVEVSGWGVPEYGLVLVLLAFACVMLVQLARTDLPRLSACRGSRYVSWLPSFSVEVTRVRAPPTPPHQLQLMARQVQQLFPQYTLNVLLSDLAATRSADLTVNNILEGRLPVPPAAPAPARPETPPPAPAPATPAEGNEASNISGTETRAAPAAPGAPAPAGAPADARDVATNTASTSAHAAAHYVYHTDVGHTSTMFSKDAAEREVQLQRRKEQLIAAARQKYLEKQQAQANAPSPSPAPGAPAPPGRNS